MKRLFTVLLVLIALPAVAQNYPAKTVRVVVPFAAGGSTDVLARMVAENLNKTQGQFFIVEVGRNGRPREA